MTQSAVAATAIGKTRSCHVISLRDGERSSGAPGATTVLSAIGGGMIRTRTAPSDYLEATPAREIGLWSNMSKRLSSQCPLLAKADMG
jgi:hypothetical protein